MVVVVVVLVYSFHFSIFSIFLNFFIKNLNKYVIRNISRYYYIFKIYLKDIDLNGQSGQI